MFVYKRVHCLFEQSGTFRDIFRSLGYEAYDYDINNQFKKTDFLVDLFDEINNSFDNKKSIFDSFRSDDLIIAFFPCVRFSVQSLLLSRCDNNAMKNRDLFKKLDYSMNIVHQIDDLFCLLNKLVIICLRNDFKLVIENPYNKQSFLIRYWCLKPSIIDYDRSDNGDFYRKPTMYYFIGFEPTNNLYFDVFDKYYDLSICESNGIERSLISSNYALRFIKNFLLN